MSIWHRLLAVEISRLRHGHSLFHQQADLCFNDRIDIFTNIVLSSLEFFLQSFYLFFMLTNYIVLSTHELFLFSFEPLYFLFKFIDAILEIVNERLLGVLSI